MPIRSRSSRTLKADLLVGAAVGAVALFAAGAAAAAAQAGATPPASDVITIDEIMVTAQ